MRVLGCCEIFRIFYTYERLRVMWRGKRTKPYITYYIIDQRYNLYVVYKFFICIMYYYFKFIHCFNVQLYTAGASYC